MAINFPSRTEATMPQPHEQKLHDVVNSLMSESLRSWVAALTAGQSSRPPTARPVPPPNVILNTSLRLTPRPSCGLFMMVLRPSHGSNGLLLVRRDLFVAELAIAVDR